jgi:hypothetical protein
MEIKVKCPSTQEIYTITNEHSASAYGIPVVLDGKGNLIDFFETKGYPFDGDMSDSAGDRPVSRTEEEAADRESIHIGLQVGSMHDTAAFEAVEAAWYGRSISF